MSETLPTPADAQLHPSPQQTLWRRLRLTPLRDLLRFRITGRLDLDAKLAAPANADLSPAARQLIRDTVKKTRLWKLEKISVADELIAHFRDAQTVPHANTNEPAQAVADFGDPLTTARLIRRAKKRGRSLAAKGYVWSRRVALMLLGFYAVVIVRFYAGSPTVSVDYLVPVNADAAAIPAADRAWPIYRDALIDMQVQKAWDDLPNLTDDREDGSGNLLRPGDPGWPAVAGWLDEHRDFFDALRRGGQLPGLGLLAQYDGNFAPRDALALEFDDSPTVDPNDSAAQRLADDSLANVLLPHLGTMRRSTRLLALDTYHQLNRGEPQIAVDNLLAMLGHARQSAEHATLINGLVGVWIYANHFCQTLTYALQQTPDAFTDEQLRSLAHAAAGLAPRDLVRPDGERFFLEDLIQRTYTDNGRGNGRLTDEGLKVLGLLTDSFGNDDSLWWDGGPENSTPLRVVGHAVMPASLLVVADRRDTTQRLETLMALVTAEYQQPLWIDGRTELDDEMQSWSLAERQRYPLLFQMMPAMGAANRTAEQAEARRDGVLLGLALELYRREHGGWPNELNNLTPRFLPTLPIDRITGNPLHYRITDAGPVIYSVGGDRDDDGGRMIIYEGTGRTVNHWAAFWELHIADDPERDGDWVIYP